MNGSESTMNSVRDTSALRQDLHALPLPDGRGLVIVDDIEAASLARPNAFGNHLSVPRLEGSSQHRLPRQPLGTGKSSGLAET